MGMTKIIVSGRLGQELELRTWGSEAMVSGSIANTEVYKNKSDEWETKTRWVDFVAYKKVAEKLAEANVGDTLILTGTIRQNVYEKDGKNIKRLVVAVDSLFGIVPKGTKGWRDINQVLLKGRKGQDWEVRTFGADGCVLSGTLACSRFKKSGDGWDELTDWINIAAFGKKAVRLSEIPKGSLIYLEGSFEVDAVQTDDGRKRNYQKVQIGRINGFIPPAGSDSVAETAKTTETTETAETGKAAEETVMDLPDFMSELNMSLDMSLDDIPFV